MVDLNTAGSYNKLFKVPSKFTKRLSSKANSEVKLNSKTERKSESRCPMNRGDFPLVSETEHAVGYCLCHLCKCGRHECPGSEQRKPMTKNAYKSTYKKHYQLSIKAEKAQSLAPMLYRSYNFPQTETSTHRQDFTPMPLPQMVKTTTPVKNPLPFVGRNSVYHRNFPDWKVPDTVLFKEFVPHKYPQHSPEVVSSYQDAFKPISMKDLKTTKNMQQLKVFPRCDLNSIWKSTNRSLYENRFSEGKELNENLGRSSDSVGPSFGYKNQYKSKYNQDFLNLSPTKFTRRKILINTS